MKRARLQPGETVLINGATGAAGSLAVSNARHLGAARVIATGRDAAALAAAGADDVVDLNQDSGALDSAFQSRFARRVDVVLDYLWGPSARSLLAAAARRGPDGVPIRFVQIGSASATEIEMPAAVLRSSSIVMLGSGLGSVGLDRLTASIEGVLGAAHKAGFNVAHRTMPLSDVEAAWRERGGPRVVLTT